MRPLLLTLAFLCTLSLVQAEVIRLAPDFSFPGVASKQQSLKGLRGQPVVLIIAKSPKDKDFKTQVRNLKGGFQQFANKQVIFVAAFSEEVGPVQSDIPFVVANNGAAVARAYSVENKPDSRFLHVLGDYVPGVHGSPNGFSIAIIGKDGNVDYQTNMVIGGDRVRDVIQNSYAVQSTTGR